MSDDTTWRREYLGEWTLDQRQCEVTTRRELRCPNVAKYVLWWAGGERNAEVCDSCTLGWLHTFTQRGPVTVERIPYRERLTPVYIPDTLGP